MFDLWIESIILKREFWHTDNQKGAASKKDEKLFEVSPAALLST